MSRWHTAAWIFLALLSVGAGPGQAPALTGRVLLGFFGQRPVPQTKVTLEGLNPTRTDSQGVFVISLRPDTQPGERIKLELDESGYCILSPFNGEVVVPKDGRPVEVRLLRAESKQGTTQDCLAELIKSVATQPKNLTRPAQKPEPLDLPDEMQAWASRQGIRITKQQAVEVMDRWITAIKTQPQIDPYLHGLARFAEKQFTEAHQLFTQAAEQEEKLLAQARERVIRNYQLAGYSASQDSNFDAALEAYQKALQHVSRTTQPILWATVLRDLSGIHRELGIRVLPLRAQEHLVAAVSSCLLALQVFTKEQHPQQWARTQNSLGLALCEQGQRALGAESLRLLAESAKAYRLALQAFTEEQQPQDWALTQNNLGNVLQEQGERASGAEALQLLRESVQAYRLALHVFTKEQHPQGWSRAQHNLGTVLKEQGLLATGAESVRLLAESVKTFASALQVRTREQHPQDWAATQNNLGNALQGLGRRTAGAESLRLLKASSQAFELALQVYTREQLPQDWARVQSNLGLVLFDLGLRMEGTESLRLFGESMKAHRSALQVCTREQLPQAWANTQNHLGNALQELGLRTEGVESLRLLSESVQTYRLALQILAPAQLPHDWAGVQCNIGNALHQQAVRVRGADSLRLLDESVQAYRLALQVYTRDRRPQLWSRTQHKLGNALQELGLRATGAQSLRLLAEAVDAYQLALQIRTREQWPQEWIRTQCKLGNALQEQGMRATGTERLRLLGESASTYRLILVHHPDLEDVFVKALALYREQLGAFDIAHALLQHWLRRHPDDVVNQVRLAESHLTTGHFAESAQQLAVLLARPELTAYQIPLHLLEVVALTMLEKNDELPGRLKSLRVVLAAQPRGVSLGWRLAAVKAFLAWDERLVARRSWLLTLLAAVELPDREARLAALDAIIAQEPAVLSVDKALRAPGY